MGESQRIEDNTRELSRKYLRIIKKYQKIIIGNMGN